MYIQFSGLSDSLKDQWIYVFDTFTLSIYTTNFGFQVSSDVDDFLHVILIHPLVVGMSKVQNLIRIK